MKPNHLVAMGTLLFLSSPAFSDGDTIFYRNATGDITQESRQHAKTMSNIAKEQGYVTLWVVFDLPLTENMHNMTEKEQAEHEVYVANYAHQVLGSLVTENQVWHPKTGPMIAGLGCHVRATRKGLNQLIKEKRIIQIVATDDV